MVLQTLAWTQMAAEYSQNRSLVGSLEKTFNGKNPCKLCNKIQEGRQKEEQRPALLQADKKAEVILPVDLFAAAVRYGSSFSYPWKSQRIPASHREAPPGPIPILRAS